MRIVILFIGIAILFYALTARGPASKTPPLQTACVNEPDPKHVAIYNDAVYRRIRADTPIFYKEVPVHFAPTTPFELYVDGKFRKSYVPWFDGNTDNYYVNWRPLAGVNTLLFVDRTDDRGVAESGFHYYDIYIKPDPGTKLYYIPDFIQVYCRALYPIANKTMYPNKSGDFIPPAFLNPADIDQSSWKNGNGGAVSVLRPPQVPFYIAQYDALDSPVGKIMTDPIWASADLTLHISGITKKYKVYWVPAVMQNIVLVDKDTSSPDSKIIYKYTYPSADFEPNFAINGSNTGAKPNLQLETFNYPILHAFGWWTPECKPAIYLYPTEKTKVNVTVKPDGYLTYTDPLYPANGWSVTADTDGTLTSGGKTYPYLYYESKIRDAALTKPTKGYVVPFKGLPALFDDVMPKLGLSAKETDEFKAYWEGKLPEANYYFVGVMEEKAIDAIEPLTIQPAPDTVIRARLYFEALDKKRTVTAPKLQTPERKGFVVSEWGGLVKTDKNHPFTCSQ
jgi:hypothetical protein